MDNTEHGIQIQDCTAVTVTDNTIAPGTQNGIRVIESPDDCTVVNNSVGEPSAHVWIKVR